MQSPETNIQWNHFMDVPIGTLGYLKKIKMPLPQLADTSYYTSKSQVKYHPFQVTLCPQKISTDCILVQQETIYVWGLTLKLEICITSLDTTLETHSEDVMVVTPAGQSKNCLRTFV